MKFHSWRVKFIIDSYVSKNYWNWFKTKNNNNNKIWFCPQSFQSDRISFDLDCTTNTIVKFKKNKQLMKTATIKDQMAYNPALKSSKCKVLKPFQLKFHLSVHLDKRWLILLYLITIVASVSWVEVFTNK